MELQTRKMRDRRMRQLRKILCAALIVWGIFGLVGLLTVLRWLVDAVSGNGERAYGHSVTAEMKPGPYNGSGMDGAGDPDAGADVSGSGEGTKEGDGAGVFGTQRYVFSEEEKETCGRLYRDNPKLLVLVNKEKELDENYDSSLRSICKGRLQVSDWMYSDLVDMLAAASREGYTYWIASAYRSRKRQQELIDEDVERLMARGMSYSEALAETLTETMPAGHSEHETGLALDMLCSGNEDMDISQARMPGNRWLLTHCFEYGFILRYPAEKTDITDIAYEPWHFRYVGREAAKFIMDRGITLEEFFEAAGA